MVAAWQQETAGAAAWQQETADGSRSYTYKMGSRQELLPAGKSMKNI